MQARLVGSSQGTWLFISWCGLYELGGEYLWVPKYFVIVFMNSAVVSTDSLTHVHILLHFCISSRIWIYLLQCLGFVITVKQIVHRILTIFDNYPVHLRIYLFFQVNSTTTSYEPRLYKEAIEIHKHKNNPNIMKLYLISMYLSRGAYKICVVY